MNQPELEALKAKAALADRLLIALEDLYNAMMAPGCAENVDVLIAARHAAVLVMIDANPKKAVEKKNE